MTLAIVLTLWLAGCGAVAFGLWYGLVGRRKQIETLGQRPLRERLHGSPYDVVIVAAALMRWRAAYEAIVYDGEHEEELDVFLGIVEVEFRAGPWRTRVGLAAGQVLNPEAVQRGHAAPRIAVAEQPSIYTTALGHELTDAWHLWSGSRFKSDPSKPWLGLHVDQALEAQVETRWRRGG